MKTSHLFHRFLIAAITLFFTLGTAVHSYSQEGKLLFDLFSPSAGQKSKSSSQNSRTKKPSPSTSSSTKKKTSSSSSEPQDLLTMLTGKTPEQRAKEEAARKKAAEAKQKEDARQRAAADAERKKAAEKKARELAAKKAKDAKAKEIAEAAKKKAAEDRKKADLARRKALEDERLKTQREKELAAKRKEQEAARRRQEEEALRKQREIDAQLIATAQGQSSRPRGGFFSLFSSSSSSSSRSSSSSNEAEEPRHVQSPPNRYLYINEPEVAHLSASNSRIEIDLSDQRARIYKGSTLIIETQISTGKPGHATPTGYFTVQEMLVDKKSGRYGTWYDAAGNELKGDDHYLPPPGASKFVGADMPYWMRITGGIGMHIGYVPDGPASHGCVRVPSTVQPLIFSKVRVGTPIRIRY